MPALDLLILVGLIAPALTVGSLWAAGRCFLGMEFGHGR